MNRPVHFEIPADDVERAVAFYQKTFGWTIKKWDGPIPYWMVTTGPEDEGGINGGKVAVPRMPIPGMGWLAYCIDTEGHVFGMMQPDTSAK